MINVDGITIGRLVDAIRAGDLKTVRSMVRVRPELVHMDVAEHDEHRALHHAVLQRQSDIVRFLMQHGADPRKGIYPYRDATGALTLAADRGYTEIVEIICDEEQRRTSKSPLAVVDEKVLVEMNAVLRRDDEDASPLGVGLLVAAHGRMAPGPPRRRERARDCW